MILISKMFMNLKKLKQIILTEYLFKIKINSEAKTLFPFSQKKNLRTKKMK